MQRHVSTCRGAGLSAKVTDVPNVLLSQILQSRAEGPVVDSHETLEALRKLALRMMSNLEPVNDRSKYFDVRLFEDGIRALDIVPAPGRKVNKHLKICSLISADSDFYTT